MSRIEPLNRRIKYLLSKTADKADLHEAVRAELRATQTAVLFLRACAGIELDDLVRLLVGAKRYAQSHDLSDLAALGQVADSAMTGHVYRPCSECKGDMNRRHKKKCSLFDDHALEGKDAP